MEFAQIVLIGGTSRHGMVRVPSPSDHLIEFMLRKINNDSDKKILLSNYA